jgi:hypothetical protein
MQSKATTVKEYLAELPPERREAIAAVRKVVSENVDDDIEEGMHWGMICWYVPHRVFPDGYHTNPRLPLPYAALASQKNYMSLYLNTVYGEGGEAAGWFRSEWEKTGRKLDMGKTCIRFKKVADLPLDVIAKAVRQISTKEYIAMYQENLPASAKKKAGGKKVR